MLLEMSEVQELVTDYFSNYFTVQEQEAMISEWMLLKMFVNLSVQVPLADILCTFTGAESSQKSSVSQS